MIERIPGEAEITLPQERLLDIINSGWMAQAAFVAAQLGIADLLADGRRSSAELAAAAGVHAPSLHRLLRALCTLGICKECEDGFFEITATGALLGTRSAQSLQAWATWSGGHMWPVWGNLLYSVTTGKSARALLTGKSGFGHLEQDAAAATVFNRALTELTRLAAQGILAACDFSRWRKIVDVGGGHGELLACILQAHPSLSGVLFDRPHAIAGARAGLEAAQVAGRCMLVEGDFFVSVPPGADAYILKSVLHDWNDADAARILLNCRRALSDGAPLLLIERVMPERLDQSADHRAVARSDLHMLVALAARERTAAELRVLLDQAGLSLESIAPAGAGLSVLTARRTG